MVLRQVLQECPDRLEADLRRVYGVRLDDFWSGRERPGHIAALLAHLPRGSAVHGYYGGPSAVSAEVESLWLVEQGIYRTNTSKPDRVKAREFPTGVRAEEQKVRDARARAERWRAQMHVRQLRLSGAN